MQEGWNQCTTVSMFLGRDDLYVLWGFDGGKEGKRERWWWVVREEMKVGVGPSG
jgi:hypothetical protein